MKSPLGTVGKVPWRRKWQPAPIFFPREVHGQRSLVGYSPWGHKDSDTAEGLTLIYLSTSTKIKSCAAASAHLQDPMKQVQGGEQK